MDKPMDRQRLGAQVQDALEKLMHRHLLQIHPLAALLVPDATSSDRGTALKEVLLDAMQRIRPSPTVAYDSPAWRRYRSFFQFYLEGKGFDAIAAEQGVSTRQTRRDLHQAVDEVGDFLWARYGEIHQTPDPATTAGPAEPKPGLGAEDALWESEIARIGSLPRDEPVRVEFVLRDAVALADKLAGRLGTRLTLAIAEGLPAAAVNQTVLRQILLSLLGWVLDVSRGGDVIISAVEVGRGVEISIRVGGWRDDPTTGAEVGSRLRLSERLLELQGGRLAVLGPRAGSAEVRVTLPSVEAPTILVVDDNPDVLRLFQRYVPSPHLHLVQATSAEHALHYLAESHPQLIILDLMMPVRDGWDLLQALLREPTTSDVPIAVCSVVHERSLALAMGASYFLPKPVGRAALLEVLAQCGLGTVDRL